MATIPFNKLSQYEFEDECRLVKMFAGRATDEDRQMEMPNSAYHELMIGFKTAKKDQELLYQQAKNLNKSMKVSVSALVHNKVVIKPY